MNDRHPTPRLELLPLKAGLPAAQDSELTFLARIHPATAHAQSTDAPRPPLNLALVIDRSGSMSGTPLQMAREAAQVAIWHLQPHDRVSVVTFDDEIETLIPSQPVTNPAALCREIERITAGGSTALHAGWLDGAMQVAQHLNPQALNRTLLLSDGQANAGLTDRGEIARQVAGLTARGVSTSTIGLGGHYDEDLLRAMADAGDGNYEHIEDAGQLPAYFAAELGGLSRTSGHTVSLGVEPNPALGSLRCEVLNDLPQGEFGRWQLRNLITGAPPVEVVVTLHVPAQTPQDSLGITRVRLAWTGRDGVRRRLRGQLDLPVLSAAAHAALPEHQAVRDALELQRTARAKSDAVHFLDAGDVAGAQAALQSRRLALYAAPMAAPLRAQEIAQLDDLAQTLQDRPAVARKRAFSQNYDQSRSKIRR